MAAVFVFLLYRRVRRTNLKLREANKQLEFHSVREPADRPVQTGAPSWT